MKTFAIFLLSKETFTIKTCSILESFFRKLLSKATFERKLSSVSLTLVCELCEASTKAVVIRGIGGAHHAPSSNNQLGWGYLHMDNRLVATYLYYVYF